MPRPFFIQKSDIDKIIRVDHAGELGANFIYKGQEKYIEDTYKDLINDMLLQEIKHLKYFDNMIVNFSVRPTILISFWKIFGYFIGVLSSKMGVKHAMLLTESVEDVIEKHYQQQIDFLCQTKDKKFFDLKKNIIQFQKEESEHKHIAIGFEPKRLGLKKLLLHIIQYFCKQSIFVSKYI